MDRASVATIKASMPKRRRLGDGAAAIIFLAPATLLAAVFMLYPIVNTVAMSLYRVDQFGRFKAFRGFANYGDLAADSKFVDAVVRTFIWTMTEGGPAGATDTLVTYLYKLGFKLYNVGSAAAVAIVIFLILLAFAVVHTRLMWRNVLR